ncbi:MAG: AbrB/MazE/SpoVT family DNA-binding domain-containing protein [Propionibacteriaceae bacterium]|jgi:AbrB family looped-hinge helix DNA binding protein|nr:AbrB/MazE/SpoVT family DNA-binding domain-containing protein [Propionibacteriaceae bacterium]
MGMTYATVTSKGQVTLPVELRRALGIVPGQTVGFTVGEGRAVMEPAGDVETVRSMLERAARRNGTWGTKPDVHKAWQEAAVERYADA